MTEALDRYLEEHPGAQVEGNTGRGARRRLTPEQVAMVRDPGANRPALAREFGVSSVALWKVAHRITYRWLP